jgi:hypothetical protein
MARKQTKSTSNPVVGEICLYGAQHCGHGYIAQTANGRMFGDGEPVAMRSATAAMWIGLESLRSAGCVGNVNVFAPGGRLMAVVNNRGAFPFFGNLEWQPASVLVISAADIIAAAEKQEAERQAAGA